MKYLAQALVVHCIAYCAAAALIVCWGASTFEAKRKRECARG